MKTLTADIARELMNYDPATGVLTWKARDPSWFNSCKRPAQYTAATWNARYAGTDACSYTANGYLRLSVFKKGYLAHRVIWLIVNGTWPTGEIDHKNGHRSDNRLSNLRDVSHRDNNRNSQLPSDNKSGAIGVRWHRQRGKWEAHIGLNGRFTYLGIFSDFDDAVAARKAAERDLGFHPNHGRAPQMEAVQ